ncbi:MAG: protein kinase [bacterium]
MSPVNIITPKPRINVVFISGSATRVNDFIGMFRKTTGIPTIKSSLTHISRGLFTKEHGLSVLCDLKKIVDNIRNHSNDKIRSVVLMDVYRSAQVKLNETILAALEEVPANPTGEELDSVKYLAGLKNPEDQELCDAAKKILNPGASTAANTKSSDLTLVQEEINRILAAKPPVDEPTVSNYRALSNLYDRVKEILSTHSGYLGSKLFDLQSNIARVMKRIVNSGKLPSEALILHPLEVGNKRYQITEYIASGGFGTVVIAEEIDDTDKPIAGKEPVAIKFLKSTAEEMLPGIGNRFAAESEIMVNSNHPNIAKGFGIGVYKETGRKDQAFLVMEYIKASPKSDLFSLSNDRKLALAKKAVAGFSALWAKGVIHRDIKLDNVLVTLGAKPEDDIVKITDLGIAKNLAELSDPEKREAQTQTGVILGTIPYLAPELLLIINTDHNKRVDLLRAADAKTDIFAFGIMLFNLYTGALPDERKLDAKQWVMLSYANGNNTNSFTLKYDPRVPMEIWPIILKCTAHAPEHRYQSGSELMAALESASAHQMPVMSTNDTVSAMISIDPSILAAQNIGGQAALIKLLELDVAAAYPLDTISRTPEIIEQARSTKGAILAVIASLEKFDPNNSQMSVLREKINHLDSFVNLSMIPECLDVEQLDEPTGQSDNNPSLPPMPAAGEPIEGNSVQEQFAGLGPSEWPKFSDLPAPPPPGRETNTPPVDKQEDSLRGPSAFPRPVGPKVADITSESVVEGDIIVIEEVPAPAGRDSLGTYQATIANLQQALTAKTRELAELQAQFEALANTLNQPKPVDPLNKIMADLFQQITAQKPDLSDRQTALDSLFPALYALVNGDTKPENVKKANRLALETFNAHASDSDIEDLTGQVFSKVAKLKNS